MKLSFSGQRENELCLLKIHKSKRFWLRKAFSWWVTGTFFALLLFAFSSLLLQDFSGAVLLLILFLVGWTFYIALRFIGKREKNALIVSNQRLLKIGKKSEASLKLSEVVDIVVEDKNHYLGGSLVFNGGSKVDMQHVANAPKVAHFIQVTASKNA